MKNEDNRLIKELKEKKVSAFEQIYDRYAPVVYGIIRHHVKDEEQACFLLRKTFVTLCQEIPQKQLPNNGILVYLINLARNLSLESADNHNNNSDTQNGEMIFETIFYKGSSLEDIAKANECNREKAAGMLRNAIKQLRQDN